MFEMEISSWYIHFKTFELFAGRSVKNNFTSGNKAIMEYNLPFARS